MEKIHLQLTPEQNIFFTSDLHFGHRNILTFCHRPFETTKEMNDKIIQNWNNVVGENDIVFSLGDFTWFPGRSEYYKLFNKLNGTIYFIPGNHDDISILKESIEKYHYGDKVHICSDIVTLYLEAPHLNLPRKINEVIMCHYPLWTWSHMDKQTIHLYGHVHSEHWRDCNEFNIPINHRKNCLDTGADAHNYTPLDIKRVLFEIKENGLELSDKRWGLQGYSDWESKPLVNASKIEI